MFDSSSHVAYIRNRESDKMKEELFNGNILHPEELEKHKRRMGHRPVYSTPETDLVYKRFLDVYKAAGSPSIHR